MFILDKLFVVSLKTKLNTINNQISEATQPMSTWKFYRLFVGEYLRSRLGMLLPEKYESIFDASSEGPSSGGLLNFPTKGLRSKRRRYFHIFRVEAYLTYCEDIYEVSTYTGSCCFCWR